MESVEDQRFQVLVRDYEVLSARKDEIDGRYWTIIGGGLGIASLIAGYVLANPENLQIAVLAPLFFIAYFSVLVYLLYINFNTMWSLRVLSLHINALLDQVSLIQFEYELPESRFFSLRNGNPKYRLLYFLIPGSAVALFVAVLWHSAITLHPYNHLYATLVVVIYTLLGIMLIVALLGAFFDLAKIYRRYLDLMASVEFKSSSQLPDGIAFRNYLKVRRAFGATVNWILPRPVDFVIKQTTFWIGFVAAMVTIGISSSQTEQANFLFFPGPDPVEGQLPSQFQWPPTFASFFPEPVLDPGGWLSPSQVSWSAILALGIAYFLVSEVLLQQAKLLWNDVRDESTDNKEPVLGTLYGSSRGVQSGAIGRDAGAVHAIVRWILALLLGWLLGGGALLALFVLISLHQVVYELMAKPRAEDHPVFILLWLSATLPLKFLTGALAVVGPNLSESINILFHENPHIPLLLILGYLHMLGQMAIVWRLEAEEHHAKHRKMYCPEDSSTRDAYIWDQGERGKWPYGNRPRPQTYYYATCGQDWQDMGVFLAFITATDLLLMWCMEGLWNTGLPLLIQLAIALVAPIAIVLSIEVGVRAAANHNMSVIRRRRKNLASRLFLPLFFLGAFSVVPLSLIFLTLTLSFGWLSLGWAQGSFYVGLALVNGAYLFLDPYVSLYQYKFAPFLAGIAPVGKAWYAYLFKPEMGLGFGDTFGFTDSALNADPGADGSIIRVRSHPEKLYVVCGNGKFRLTRKDITIKEDLNEQLAITTDPNPKRLIAITIDNESFSAVLTNWPRNGTLLKFQNATDPKKEELAFVVGGAALDVDCESALRQMGRDESEACLIPTAAARLMRTRVPVDGTLLKEWSGSTIYKMDQGVRRTFEGGDGAEVVKVPDGSLKVLPLVDSVTRIGTSSR